MPRCVGLVEKALNSFMDWNDATTPVGPADKTNWKPEAHSADRFFPRRSLAVRGTARSESERIGS